MRIYWAAVSVVALLLGCAGPPKTRTPMPVMRTAFSSSKSNTLMIFLPGRRDHEKVFEKEGLLAVVHRHEFPADLIATDAHLGYYIQGSLVRQLHDEIIEPAHKHGYKHIILVGVSLGGYGAVRYAMDHPGEVSTIVLLAPFLGTGPFMREFAEAGDEDFEQTWTWLKKYPKLATAEERTAAGYPRIILGYGQEDMFLPTDGKLRDLLPPDDVFTAPGGHLWGTWRTLLDRILEKGILPGKTKAQP